MKLNQGQQRGITILNGKSNVFLTGQAGVGKTTLVKTFLSYQNTRRFPVVASTGVAALLAGGRTAHSAFGLGTMQGGPLPTIRRALENPKVVARLNYWKGFLIDEVSMVDAAMFGTMEHICRQARENDKPWGGLRVIAVGDFAQLPPVDIYNRPQKNWAFKSAVWGRSQFFNIMLTEVMRTSHPEFIEVLNFVRRGIVNEQVEHFLESHRLHDEKDFDGTRLFGKRADVDAYNRQKLRELPGEEISIETEYMGADWAVQQLKKRVPVGDEVTLKKGALVMIRTNDPDDRYVNGSLGWVVSCESKYDPQIQIRLMDSGEYIWLDKYTWPMNDGDGNPIAEARNFPLSLAYAMTIHKTQGATLDKVLINASDFWEAGQCYVALSRVRSPEGLFIKAWEPSSILADKEVMAFYDKLLQEENEWKAGSSSSAQLTLTSTPE